jgi:phage shock protein A
MSDAEQIFVAGKEEVEEKAKKVPKKAEQAVGFLDETQQRAAAAYAAYIEAQRQLEEAYKEQERQAEKVYTEAVEQARKACEESINQALRARDEAEQKAWEARNETIERTWAIFTKARK